MSDFSQEERDALAYMLMRSLRGSFFPVNPRCVRLKQVAEEGLSVYDSQRIIDKVEWHVERDYADGRTFRGIYQEGPQLPDITDKQTVKGLVGYLSDDLTWDERQIEREFDTNE